MTRPRLHALDASYVLYHRPNACGDTRRGSRAPDQREWFNFLTFIFLLRAGVSVFEFREERRVFDDSGNSGGDFCARFRGHSDELSPPAVKFTDLHTRLIVWKRRGQGYDASEHHAESARRPDSIFRGPAGGMANGVCAPIPSAPCASNASHPCRRRSINSPVPREDDYIFVARRRLILPVLVPSEPDEIPRLATLSFDGSGISGRDFCARFCVGRGAASSARGAAAGASIKVYANILMRQAAMVRDGDEPACARYYNYIEREAR
ncbi:hypothetical protein FB451DRAFT_1184507 [Mycena latifolia]|nr:hypothetical protein FB451DRAFT_1184507 [Mycena latifolia]